MKKILSRVACLLLSALVLLASLPALAESPAFPINTPPAFGQVPTQFALFTGNPVDYTITLQVDDATGLRTYTIENALSWGMDASVPGTYEYDNENAWQRTGDAPEGQVQLLLTSEVFEEQGFPVWSALFPDGVNNLDLEIYLGELRHLYAYVNYYFNGNTISVTADDHSFVVECVQYDPEEDNICTTYASYDPAGVLAYVSYTNIGPYGSLLSYTVDADLANKTYRLSDIAYTDDAENSYYWNRHDGQWQNGNFEPTDAPEGISTETLPFTIVGDWAGIPFEQPGDKAEGIFPAATADVDPALMANQYRPWPQETTAIYRNFAAAGPIPVLPEVSWQTQEDGSTLYTLTGIERWALPESAMVNWTWDDSFHQWMDAAQATPGQLTLAYPADADLSTLFWDHSTTTQDEQFMLDLSRSNLTINAGFDNLTERFCWQMDNQGSLVYTRWLDDTRSLEAIYDDYVLVEYNIHQSDADGNRLSQACYSASDENPDLFELGCFFLYSPEMNYEETLWIKDVGWYSYETGDVCDAPEGIDLAQYPPLELK